MKAKEFFGLAQPWLSLVFRLAAGCIMILAGVLKLADLDLSAYSVRSYELLPEAMATPVGYALPFLEIAIGFFLVFGLLTRWVAGIYLLLLLAFMFGTFWVRARGLEIDCGCFGGGGPVIQADSLTHLWEQVLFTSLGAWLAVFPKSRLAVDGWLNPTK